MTFLPTDYKTPSSSNLYLKLQEGENKFRILSKPILGWEEWTLDKKPMRYTMEDKPSKPIAKDKPPKHFWAFIVYNYATDCVQIMQVTQNSIRKSIEALCRDTDWGDPYYYDIKITKSGSGMDTEYKVNPIPHKPIDGNILQAFKDQPIWLDAMFVNGDPFASDWKEYTPLAHEGTEKITSINSGNKVSADEAMELEKLILGCDPKMQTRFWSYVERNGLGRDIMMLDRDSYTKIRPIILEKNQQYQYSLVDEEPKSMDEVTSED